MATYPTPEAVGDSAAEDLNGTTHARTGGTFVPENTDAASSPSLQVQFDRDKQIVLDAMAEAVEMQVVRMGGLNIGVFPGQFEIGLVRMQFDGAQNVALADDATNYVYLDEDGALQTATSLPADRRTYLLLAKAVTSGGQITGPLGVWPYLQNMRGVQKNKVAEADMEFAAYVQGGLNIYVHGGSYELDATEKVFAGGSIAVDDDATTKVWLNDSNVLTKGGDWPAEFGTFVKIAEVAAAGGSITSLVSKVNASRMSWGLPDGAVETAKIADGAVTNAKIAPDAVTGDKIPDNAVDTEHIADSAVDTAQIAPDAVTGAKIPDGAVGNEHIAAGAVGTTELAADAVTSDKIPDGAVDAEHIAANSVSAIKLTANAVTNSKITDDAVDNAKIAAGAVDTTELAAQAVTNGKIADGAVLNAKLGVGAVHETNIAAGAVTEAKLASNAVTEAKLASNAVTQAKMADHAVGTDEITEALADEIRSANVTKGSQTGDLILVTIQVRDVQGNNLGGQFMLDVWLSDSQYGGLTSTAPDIFPGSVMAGVKLRDVEAGKYAQFVTNSAGKVEFYIEENGADSWWVNTRVGEKIYQVLVSFS